MVDYFSIGLTHLLLALAAWRLAMRNDLDRESPMGSGKNGGNVDA